MKKNLFLILGILVLDQLTKFLVLNRYLLFDTKHFGFNLVKNTGSSFGMLQGYNSYLVWISLIVLGGIIYYYPSSDQKISLSLIFAGVLGNFIDRVFLGFVVDFVDFKFFPVFNVADSAITIGIIWLIWEDIKTSKVKKSHA